VKKFLFGIIVGILIVFGGVYCYFVFGFAPVATADHPMPMETYFASRALRARMFKEAPKRNVSGFTTAQLVAGAHVYQKNCSFCHGLPDQTASAASQGMFPEPPQLFTEDGMVNGDPPGLTYWKVKNGIRLAGMPGFHASLSDEQMWEVTALVARADKLPQEAVDALKPASPSSGKADPPDPPAATASQLAPDWKDARQISAPELVKRLAGPASQRPVILQVGYQVLYDGAHIPGAIYAGPASTAEGLARLRAEAEKIPRGKEIVIYCGCCPWEKCPNVHPAYDELRKMRFTNLVVLLIPQDFHHDWIVPGYPIERGR
jgi:mono/diheme cytochrome c family protein